MEKNLLCIPCTVRTAYDIATRATNDEGQREKIVMNTIKWIVENPEILKISPTSLHTYVFRLSQKITGNPDPFNQIKKVSNEIAMKIVNRLEKNNKEKSFEEKFKLAALGTICGNTIDFEVEGHQLNINDLQSSLIRCLSGSLDIDDTSEFMQILSDSSKVLYLMDNAGEIVFDKFFIKTIKKRYTLEIYAVVKESPILNDATLDDARQIKLEEVAQIITTGNNHIGLRLEEASKEFLEYLSTVDLIIAKGQGNYESIMEIEHLIRKPIVYILRAKCIKVAEMLRIKQNGNIVKFVSNKSFT
jgi:uncharacterized protein with ATP-grasp and redox domains